MFNRILQVLLALSVGIVLFFGITPKVIGIGIRDATVTSLLELIPPETRGQLTINETQFDNGWFRSTAQINIAYAALDLGDELSMLVEFDIVHGPFILTEDGPKLGLAHATIKPSFNSAEITSALTQIPFELPSLSFDLFAAFDQSLAVTVEVAPVSYDDSRAQVSFAGMTGSLQANPDLSSEVLLSVGTLQAEDRDSQFGFNLAGLELQSSSSQMNDILAPSSGRLTIPALSTTGPVEINVRDILIDSQIQASSITGALDISQDIRVASIESDFPIASFSWTSEVNQLQSQIIRSYYELISNLQAQITANPGTTIDQSSFMDEQLGMIVLQNSLVFNNLIQTNAYGGDHSIDLKINWAGLPDTNAAADLDIAEAINAMTINLEVALDERAVMSSQFAELVDPYVQQGYLRVENGSILLNGTLENGALSVNGEDIPLDQFF
jgi:uncharacterized protein YdgA (DUF945 family)